MINTALEQYLRLTAFLGHVLGPDYEVALHDLNDLEHSLIAVANSQVSGRKLGTPLPSAARKLLQETEGNQEEFHINYRGVTGAGKSLRSSTLLIRSEGRPVGMLCINFDDSKYQQVSQSILKLCHPDAFVETNFQVDEDRVRELDVNAAYAETMAQSLTLATDQEIESALNASKGRGLSTRQRQDLVHSLYMGGAFLIKDAAKRIAKQLSVSQATLYRDLQRAKKQQAPV